MPPDDDQLLASADAEPTRDIDPAALRARSGRARRRARLLTGLGIVVVMLVAAPLLVARGPVVDLEPADVPETARLALPEAGAVRADVLDDGAPVFVVTHEGGSVSVLSAISPRLDLFAVFCPSDRTFWDPHHGSRWDERGRYLGGPAPAGLTPYATTVEQAADGSATVVVGPRGTAPAREVPPFAPAGPPCDWIAGDPPAGERLDGVVGHDLAELYGELRRPEEAEVAAYGYARYDARVASIDGSLAVCSPRAEPGCPDGSPALVSLFHQDGQRDLTRCTGHLDAELLARRTPAGFVDAAISAPFAGVGEPAAEGYDDQMACVPVDHPEPVASVTGTLVAVETEGDAWTAVLAEPAAPEPLDGDEGADGFDRTPRSRFPFAATATIQRNPMLSRDRVDVSMLQVGPGEQMPQTSFRPSDLARRLAGDGPLPIALTLLPDGSIAGGMLNPLEPTPSADPAAGRRDLP